MSSSDTEEEANSKPQPQKIRIHVKWVRSRSIDGQDDCLFDAEEMRREKAGEVNFRVDDDLELRWLMVRYCNVVKAAFHETLFQYGASLLKETDTPRQLSLDPSFFNYFFAYHSQRGGPVDSSVERYVTVCIRMHKEEDRHVTALRDTPLKPQLAYALPDANKDELDGINFVYKGLWLNRVHTADQLGVVGGDVIDAFDFTNNSCLSIVEPHITFIVKHSETGEEAPFEARLSQPFFLVMRAYCEGNDLKNGAEFIHKGRKLMPYKTVGEEKLEDGSEVLAVPR